MTLIGRLAIHQQPAFIAALLVAGEKGLGRTQAERLEQSLRLLQSLPISSNFVINAFWLSIMVTVGLLVGRGKG